MRFVQYLLSKTKNIGMIGIVTANNKDEEKSSSKSGKRYSR